MTKFASISRWVNPFQTWQDAGIDAISISSLYATEPRGFWAETILHTNMNLFMYYLYIPYVFDKYQSSELKIVKIKNVITPFRKCM